VPQEQIHSNHHIENIEINNAKLRGGLESCPIEKVICTVPGLSCFEPSPFLTAAEEAFISNPNSLTFLVEMKELLAPVSRSARYSSFMSITVTVSESPTFLEHDETQLAIESKFLRRIN
jgi:hypothetical protein